MKPARLGTAILCLVIIEVTGQSEVSRCGQLPSNLKPLMTHSQPTQHRWPWHAAIFHVSNEQELIYQCGGSVISSNRILTAVPCVSNNNRPMKHNQISVSLGRFNLSDVNETSAQWRTVADIILHPNYDSLIYNNNIAIIKLSIDIKFNEFVEPICLWRANKTDFSEIDGRLGTVVGWGQTETGELSTVLKQASMSVISPLVCLESHRDFVGRYLSQTNFCAGLRNGTDVCSGDAGGSMTFEENGIYYMRGIVSVGPAKLDHTTNTFTCDAMAYIILTDVARYLPWITSHFEEKVRCAWDPFGQQCHIHITNSQYKIIVFNDMSITSATELHIHGDLDALPDISDAATKFVNLKRLDLGRLKLQIVDRARLNTFSKIKDLSLTNNEISQLAPDTFDDLTGLTRLELDNNKLRELHADTFNGLPNLKSLSLNGNQIETLPANIFHNNPKLETIYLRRNNLKELHADTFIGLDNLRVPGRIEEACTGHCRVVV